MESKTFTTSRAAITMTGEDVKISIDGKEVLYWHGDEWIEDHNVVFAILNAVLMAVQNPDALMKKCYPSYIPNKDLEKAVKDFLIVSDECSLMDTTGDKAFEYREKQAALRDIFKLWQNRD